MRITNKIKIISQKQASFFLKKNKKKDARVLLKGSVHPSYYENQVNECLPQVPAVVAVGVGRMDVVYGGISAEVYTQIVRLDAGNGLHQYFSLQLCLLRWGSHIYFLFHVRLLLSNG